MITTIAQQKGGVGKTTTAITIGCVLARDRQRVLLVDTDPQAALTRQLGTPRTTRPTLADVLAGAVGTAEAIIADIHGVDVIAATPALAGVEMSLVAEMGRERFLSDALEPIIPDYDQIVIDTPPNLGLLTVNALVCAHRVIAPVSAEDEGALHGILELRQTITRLSRRLDRPEPPLVALLTRWMPLRVSSPSMELQLRQHGLVPHGRIPARPAAIAQAAHDHTPLAISAPDHPVTLAYHRTLEELTTAAVG